MRTFSSLPVDLRRLLFGTLFFGAAGGIFMASLNNYLEAVHGMDAEARGWLELPRELPGFLIFVIAAFLLGRMRESRMGVVALVFTGLGAAGLGLLTPSEALVYFWVAIWSLGDHILFVVEGPLGLKLAREGKEGKRLGQLGGARNVGTILGAGIVFLIAKRFGDQFDSFFLVATACAFAAAWFYYRLDMGRGDPPVQGLIVRREYKIFYAISALFGIRKMIFLVFGSWLLVSIYGVRVETIGLLLLIGSAAGIVVRPLMGEVIDWLGERFVLAADEVLLLLVCLTYAFASSLVPAPYDLWLLFGAYVLDHLLFSLRVARTTYLKKIATAPTDITPTISLGITIDHVFAMSLPIPLGILWDAQGHQPVFLIAAAIAVAGFFVCLRIRVPGGGGGTPAVAVEAAGGGCEPRGA